MGEEQFRVRHEIGAPVDITRFAEQAIVALPPRTAKFSLGEWIRSNLQRWRNAENQQQIADRILAECRRVCDETEERSQMMQAATERRIEERIGDINFIKTELELIRKEISLELESLGIYKVRILDCLNFLQSNALTVVHKCLMLRDGRLGIDLVVDEVESALQQEIETILGGQSLLKRILEQLQEQMRRLRSTRYMVDRDLQYKQGAIDIDKSNLSLKHTDPCLSIYEGHTSLDPANISADEYNAYSAKNIRDAAREVTSARPICMCVDTLLKQVIEDLKSAYRNTNYEFDERIKETKLMKADLENLHRETTKKIADLQDEIVLLQKDLADKEREAGLVDTELEERAQKDDAKLDTDSSEESLLDENKLIREKLERLQNATACLRYLLQVQIQLEEDINVKMNTLKIDEVDCMTLRAAMDYHEY